MDSGYNYLANSFKRTPSCTLLCNVSKPPWKRLWEMMFFPMNPPLKEGSTPWERRSFHVGSGWHLSLHNVCSKHELDRHYKFQTILCTDTYVLALSAHSKNMAAFSSFHNSSTMSSPCQTKSIFCPRKRPKKTLEYNIFLHHCILSIFALQFIPFNGF